MKFTIVLRKTTVEEKEVSCEADSVVDAMKMAEQAEKEHDDVREVFNLRRGDGSWVAVKVTTKGDS